MSDKEKKDIIKVSLLVIVMVSNSHLIRPVAEWLRIHADLLDPQKTNGVFEMHIKSGSDELVYTIDLKKVRFVK